MSESSEGYDYSVDVWQLGVVILELFSGIKVQ